MATTIYTRSMRQRYRIRTWLRGHAPAPLHRLWPKGARDCHAHEWYLSDENTDRCYHCEVGVRRHIPSALRAPEFTMLLAGVEKGSEVSAAVLLRRLRESETSLHAFSRQAADQLRGSGLLDDTELAYVERLASMR